MFVKVLIIKLPAEGTVGKWWVRFLSELEFFKRRVF